MPRKPKTVAAALDTITMPLPVLQRALAAVMPAAAPRNSGRPVLKAVHIATTGDGYLAIEATDSYRLHRVLIKYPTDGVFDVMIPATWLKSIGWPTLSKRQFLDPPSADVNVANGRVAVYCGEYTWAGPTVASDIPYPTTATLLTANPPVDEGVSAFNPKYFAAAMKAAAGFKDGGHPVEVLALNPLRPCRFRAERQLGDWTLELTILLMPVRTANPIRAVA